MRETGQEMTPELLPVDCVAGMIGASQRTVWRLSAAGVMPGPVKIGALRRWRRAELLDWIASGAPRAGDRAE